MTIATLLVLGAVAGVMLIVTFSQEIAGVIKNMGTSPTAAGNAPTGNGSTTQPPSFMKKYGNWVYGMIAIITSILVLTGNLMPILYNQQLISLLLVGTGLTLIYFAVSGKEKKVKQLLLGVILILLAPTLSIIALEGKKEVETRTTTWQACRENPQQARCTNKGAAPGTEAVKAANYVGSENGTYTVRDDQWSVFGWPDGQCMMFLGGTGLLDRLDDRRNTRSLLSPLGTQTIEVKYVPKGDSWKGVVCQ